ncbi:endonuclease [Pseudonocardia sp.]|uniref:endonuclease n=1 Tax=Pseudonocardia sp. TaxID=60912 RepID=UPI002610B515|nr:endonuclease [Pseudonocardia sp.]
MGSHRSQTADAVLRRAGRTFADEAGIRLADKPAPLYRLLVLAVLLSTRISSGLAVDAAAELTRAGMGTARRMRDATWQQRVDALGRAHYRRYDESTATALGDGATLVLDRYRGDLRMLRDHAGGDPGRIRGLLGEIPRIGPVGADIFCREAQAVWPQLRPSLDGKVLDGARRIGLPDDGDGLAGLVPAGDLARLAAGLVRIALDDELAAELDGPEA